MEVSEKILQLLKQWGIPLVVVFVIVAIVLLYKFNLDIKLTELQIKQAQKDLAA